MSLPRPAAVLFDLDGTLIDTARDFARVLNAMRGLKGLDALEFAAVREKVSDGARAMVKLGFGLSEGEPGFAELRQEFLDRYAEGLAIDTVLFEGMEPLLAKLEKAGIPWGIVTNKPSVYAIAILEALGLSERCGSLVCPDHVNNTKPDPEPIFLACEQIGVSADQTWYLGDHLRDIQAGNNAGCTTIACLYGYLHADEEPRSWQADHAVDAPNELLELL